VSPGRLEDREVSGDERRAMMALARGLTPSLRRHLLEALKQLAEDDQPSTEEETDDEELRREARGWLAEVRRRDREEDAYKGAKTEAARERVLQRDEAAHKAAVEDGFISSGSPSLRTRLKTRATRARKKQEREAAKKRDQERGGGA
jgi:hypothetical protein